MSDDLLAQIIGGLAKPVSKVAIAFIDKIENAIGGLYKPIGIKRVAKAESDIKIAEAKSEVAIIQAKSEAKSEIEIARGQAAVAIIQAESEIEITDLQQRTAYRLFQEETQHQKNMEDTIAKAIPQLNEDADPNAIEDDWIINFFDKNRLVTDDEMQDVWASILAGEANCAGSYSPKTLTIIADVDQRVANLFDTFCSLCIINLEDTTAFRQSSSNFKMRDARVPIITGIMTFSGNFQHGSGESAQKAETIYKRYGFGNDEFQLLVEHGLIQDVNTHTEYSTFFYNDDIWGIMKPPFREAISQPTRISGYSLSLVGKELFHITKRSNPPEYFELLIDFLQECYTVDIDRVLF